MTSNDPSVDNLGLISLDGPTARAFLGILRAATRIITKCDAELRRAGAGIKTSDWDLLAMLAIHGSLRPSELLTKATLSGNANTLTTIVTRLEDRGYVRRDPHPHDSRGTVISLTDSGQDLFDEVFPVLVNEVILPFELRFTEDEIDALANFCERL